VSQGRGRGVAKNRAGMLRFVLLVSRVFLCSRISIASKCILTCAEFSLQICDRFRMANGCEGPGVFEWFAIEEKYIEPLRAAVKTTFPAVDILRNEGNWFPCVEWLVDYKIPFMHGYQHPGDVVLTGGDTMHWYRCKFTMPVDVMASLSGLE
jgi:hypothetical protein